MSRSDLPVPVEQPVVGWARLLLDTTDALRGYGRDELPSPLTFMHSLPASRFRHFVHCLGKEEGLHQVHAFAKRAILEPDDLVRELQNIRGRRFTRADRERLAVVVEAYGLGLIRTYRMRVHFHRVFQGFFHQGENELVLVAGFLERLVGAEAAVQKLYRKLRTKDPELREYTLYALAEFAELDFFQSYLARLERIYAKEENDFVQEAFEYLFEFDAGP